MPRWSNEGKSPLANLRLNAGLSQEKAANAMGIVTLTLIRYEKGIHDVPMGLANKMAELYAVPFESVRQAVMATRETSEAKKEP